MRATTKLRPGDRLPNGATLVAYHGDHVLAHWTGAAGEGEYATWMLAPSGDPASTGIGHYFPYGLHTGRTQVDALAEALADLQEREGLTEEGSTTVGALLLALVPAATVTYWLALLAGSLGVVA